MSHLAKVAGEGRLVEIGDVHAVEAGLEPEGGFVDQLRMQVLIREGAGVDPPQPLRSPPPAPSAPSLYICFHHKRPASDLSTCARLGDA